MKIDRCILTRIPLRNTINTSPVATVIEYDSIYAGKVKISHPVYLEFSNDQVQRWELAGINLHNTLSGKDQLFINSDFINEGIKTHNVPKTFEEKRLLTLRGLYLLIGKENKTMDQDLIRFSALGYTDYSEFCRIIQKLESQHLIEIRKTDRMYRNQLLFLGVTVTNNGQTEAERMLPKLPLINLVDSSISTGNSDIDSKINHAKDLFFKKPESLENMRSACEQLSFVLEPIRSEMEEYFTSKDVSDFFNIVNNFDIRHNKAKTKNLEYPEQLEWVFYTLLNSINTYYKLKERIKPYS